MDTIVDSLFCFFVTLGEFELMRPVVPSGTHLKSDMFSSVVEAPSGFLLVLLCAPTRWGWWCVLVSDVCSCWSGTVPIIRCPRGNAAEMVAVVS